MSFKQDNNLFQQIIHLNDLLCHLNKLFILLKQDNNSFKRLIISFEQVIYLV